MSQKIKVQVSWTSGRTVGEIKGTATAVSSGKVPGKIIFLERGHRGPLPKPGEVWVCELVRDTAPGESKGALIVRPLEKVGTVPTVPRDVLVAWLKSRGAGEPEGWVRSMGTYLYKAGIAGAEIMIGSGEKPGLFAMTEESCFQLFPFYFESEMGGSSHCKWRVESLETPNSEQPREVIRRLEANQVAREASRAASEERQRVASDSAGRAQTAAAAFGGDGRYVTLPGEAEDGHLRSHGDRQYELPWFPKTAEVLGRLEQFEHPKYLPAMAAIRASLRPDGYAPTEEELERYHARSSYEAELATATREMAGVKQAVDRWLRSGDKSPLSSDWGDPLKYSLKAVREWIAVNGPEAVRFVKRSEEAYEAETRLRRLVRSAMGVVNPLIPEDLRKEVEGTWRRSDDPEGYLSAATKLEQRVLQAAEIAQKRA